MPRKETKNARFNVFFGLMPFLKTDAVLDHLPETANSFSENYGLDIANDII